MISTSVPVVALLARLDRLAKQRHLDRDTLLSEAIAAYLEREETPAFIARPRRSPLPPSFDPNTVRAHAAAFAEEDLALAESDPKHRAALLNDEDTAE